MYFKEEIRIAIRSQLVVGVLGSRRNQLNVLFVASVCLGSQLNNVVQRNVDEGAFFDFQIHKISQPDEMIMRVRSHSFIFGYLQASQHSLMRYD
jgi:hypothetical protein